MKIKKYENFDFKDEDFDEEEKNYKELKLIPLLDAAYFPYEVEEEFISREISIHYQNDVVSIWKWDDKRLPEFKKWLLETYGEEVRKYKNFGIMAT